MIQSLPAAPMTRHVWRSGRNTIEANLRASGYADMAPSWLRQTALGCAAFAPVNGFFMFLGTVLSGNRLELLANRVVETTSADALAAQVEQSGPVVGVFLHSGLCAVVPNVLRSRADCRGHGYAGDGGHGAAPQGRPKCFHRAGPPRL
jgi:hypothetical protein